jgi:hypothetical protein
MSRDLTRYRPNELAPQQEPLPWEQASRQGPIDAWLTRRRADRTARTMQSLVPVGQAHLELSQQRIAIIESRHREFQAECVLYEAPEKERHALEVRRVQRMEEMRKEQHVHQVAEARRQTEMAQHETTRLQAFTALEDARQQLQAQKDHGYLTYEIMHRERQRKMLDIDLTIADRRRLLRLQEHENWSPNKVDHDMGDVSDETIMDALRRYREMLEMDGHDTSQIDAILRRRK